MGATVNVNGRTVVHASSDGMSIAFPDVCLTPILGVPVPIPYPNIAMSSDTADGSQDVKADGNEVMLDGSNFSQSVGDEVGSQNGVVSSKIQGKSEFVNYSFDVKIEGKGVPRQLDLMLNNKGSSLPNTPPTPELQGPHTVSAMIDSADEEDTDDVELESLEEESSG